MSRWKLGMLSALLLVAGISIFSTPRPQSDEQNQSPRPTKAGKSRQEAVRKEIEGPYKDWLYQEVPYIITDPERAVFKKLTTDEEREAFIEAFWERRNPNPGSPENEFKEEYYRRIIYANEQFGSGIPGWKTDRGRIYIMYGPPDEIFFHPRGERNERPESEGGGIVTHPFEEWRYRYLDGVGTNIILPFVDTDMNGEYHLTIDPGFKDALLRPLPSGGKTFDSADIREEFSRLDPYTKVFQPPAVKFKDLGAVVTANIPANLFPFDVRPDFIRATDETAFTPITIQFANSDLKLRNNDGVMHGVVYIYGRIARLDGHIVDTFEKSLVIDVPEYDFQQYQNHQSMYQATSLLRRGRYTLRLALKDDLNGHMGTREMDITVPSFSEDKGLMSSSLILADQIMPLPTFMVAIAMFAIGGTKVRPSVDSTFTPDRALGIYMQVYNLSIDDKTRRPSLDVRYTVQKDGKVLLDQPEAPPNLAKASQQFTVVKTLRLKDFPSGKYTAQVKVTDNLKKQTISPSAAFELR